jgi:hypothetical protein
MSIEFSSHSNHTFTIFSVIQFPKRASKAHPTSYISWLSFSLYVSLEPTPTLIAFIIFQLLRHHIQLVFFSTMFPSSTVFARLMLTRAFLKHVFDVLLNFTLGFQNAQDRI